VILTMALLQSSHRVPAVVELVLALVAVYAAFKVLTAFVQWRKRQAFMREKGCLPAPWVPSWDRIYGLDLFFKNMGHLKNHTLLEKTNRRFQETKFRTFQLVVLGRHLHQTIEPENLKTIQAIDFKKWSLGERRKTAFHPLLGEGIFTTDGAAWQHSREMLRPNFARTQIGNIDTYEKHVSHLIAAIPADGQTVDLSELFFRLTIDSATEFLFGESVETLVKGTGAGFTDAFTHSQEYIANSARWGKWAKYFPANKRFQQDAKLVHDFVDYFVDKGLAKEKSGQSDPERYVFIDELVSQTSDRVRIRSELLNILLAGRDTTASLLTNLWFVLAKRPDVWARLQADVAQLGGEKPTFEQLRDLKYLRALMNESLRIHPVVPLNSRQATEDTTLPLGGGPDGLAPLFMPKGSIVACKSHSPDR
jgi:cytochrome P450